MKTRFGLTNNFIQQSPQKFDILLNIHNTFLILHYYLSQIQKRSRNKNLQGHRTFVNPKRATPSGFLGFPPVVDLLACRTHLSDPSTPQSNHAPLSPLGYLAPFPSLCQVVDTFEHFLVLSFWRTLIADSGNNKVCVCECVCVPHPLCISLNPSLAAGPFKYLLQ